MQTTAPLKTFGRVPDLVRSSHAAVDPCRKVSNAPARKVGPSVAARFPRERPTPLVPARGSHNAAPAPRHQKEGAPLRRASAVHVRRANPSVPARRTNSSAVGRKLPLTGNRTLAARVARGLRGSNLVTAGIASQEARLPVGAPRHPAAQNMGTAAQGREALSARRWPLCSSAAPAGTQREPSTGARNRSSAPPAERPLPAMVRRSHCG